jgi:anti-sigma factor ChrR (cupin superfamily)
VLNMDFSERVVIDTANMDWVPSPAAGVWRKPLAREDVECGHATSIVRYDPGASFRGHNHPLGEEILVLEGTFSDETGDFHAGTYFRNPKGFIHAPFSQEGCIILVKLHQMAPEDTTRLAMRTRAAKWRTLDNGGRMLPLHEFGTETVVLVKLLQGTTGPAHKHPQGEEIFVIEGGFHDEFGSYGPGTWLRMPPGSVHCPIMDADSLLWVKMGHLGTA